MKNINYKKTLFVILKLCSLGVLIGILGGLVSVAFSHLLSLVTGLREGSPWLILLLPVGGIVTVAAYKFFGMQEYGGTNKIIHCLKEKSEIKPIAAPLIFICTAITHLFGGSAGKEGAAIQLGGTVASTFSKILRLKDDERTVFVMSGMGAVFAGVFGTPLTATIFVLEFRSSKKLLFLATFPCFISAVIAQKVSSLLGVCSEAFNLNNITDFTFRSVLQIIALSIGLSLLGRVMCFCFQKSKLWAKKLISNPFLCSILGTAVIIVLTIFIGDMRYSGSGIDMVFSATKGKADWFDFILKIVFTSVTLAAGFKGGEIVPTFCIGATFGCVLGAVFGLDAGFAAALGLVGLFCCTTNSPVSAVFLGIELFGIAAIPHYLLICLILWPLSVKKGLFENRFFKPPALFKKTNATKGGPVC